MKYRLMDTFNGYQISQHRTLENAVKAGRAYDKAVKRSNGQSSYIPTRIDVWDGGWSPVSWDEVTAPR